MKLSEAVESIEINTFDNLIKKISKNYKDIGYSVPVIKCKLTDTFNSAEADCAPACISNDGRTLYVDNKLYKEIKGKDKAVEELFIHEIGHAASNADHNKSAFRKAIESYNRNYSTNAMVNPEGREGRAFLAKNFPSFTTKDKMYDLINKFGTGKDFDGTLAKIINAKYQEESNKNNGEVSQENIERYLKIAKSSRRHRGTLNKLKINNNGEK